MSATFRNLFVNASEGDSSGSIAGCVPDWLLEGEGGGGMTFLYNGPAGMWDFDDGSARYGQVLPDSFSCFPAFFQISGNTRQQ